MIPAFQTNRRIASIAALLSLPLPFSAIGAPAIPVAPTPVAPAALAVPAPQPATPGLARVEVLLFARTGDSWRNAEIWPETLETPPWGGAVPLDPGLLPPHGAAATPGLVAPARFTPGLIEKGQLSMGPEAYTLNRSGRFEPLLHRAWTQPVGPEGAAVVYLESKSKQEGAAPRVQGVVTLAGGKGYQLTLDVQIHDVEVPAPQEAPPETQAGMAPPAVGPALVQRTIRFNSQRKLEPGVIHYLDHPLFGALVRVDRP